MKSSFHPLLVGTDFTPQATLGVRRAAQLAEQHGAALHVVHAHESMPARALARLGIVRTAAAAMLDAAVERLGADTAELRGRGLRVTPHLVKAGPLAAIERVAARARAELVIVGARGERSLRNTVIGSTALRVLGKLGRNVLAVRRAVSHPYRRVLVCLDGGPDSIAVLRAARRLCPEAQLWALHAFEAPFEGKLRFAGASESSIRAHVERAAIDARARVSAMLHDAGIGRSDVHVTVRRGYPPRSIAESIDRHRVELVVLGRVRTPTEEFFLGSVSKEVLRDAPCDVAVLDRTKR